VQGRKPSVSGFGTYQVRTGVAKSRASLEGLALMFSDPLRLYRWGGGQLWRTISGSPQARHVSKCQICGTGGDGQNLFDILVDIKAHPGKGGRRFWNILKSN
jgi:hypothetical protein